MIARIIIGLGIGIASVSAQWPPVPVWDYSSSSAAAFADHELDVPYHLRHFAQVANAVVENPFTDGTGTYLPRGFLNLKVNREPADNKPYNARIMEMQAALAYFYTADRPWNPYRGSTAVRLRLEAMLQRWTEMQAPPGHAFAGLFTEYSSSNWSLSPTGFGVRHAAEALDLIIDSGLPFDAAILESSRVSLRRALMAMFTRSDMRNAARQYSNQFSGAYHAALIYLENWPDNELNDALVASMNAAATQDQSPAGYWYEAGGPDFGYSNVHDSNMRIALPRLRNRPDLMPVAVGDDTEWNLWLAANLVPQPGQETPAFLINAGIETRTSDSVKFLSSRPYSEFVESSRIFSLSDTEFAASLVTRRNQVQSQFGNWGALSVPSSSSYIPSFVHDAVAPLNVWHPTAAQREAAGSLLACLSPVSTNRQFRDPRPTVFTMAKRPQYYAAVTTGNIRVTRQVYGLGLLWNPAFGVALQSVAGTSWIYGTRRAGSSTTYETANIPATTTAGGATVNPVNGVATLPQGDLTLTYALADAGVSYGQKTITLGEDRVDLSISHSGSFAELLPLAHASDAILSNTGNRLTLTRPGGSSFAIEVTSPGATISVGGTSNLTSGLVRRPVTISADGALSYSLTVSDANPSPPEIIDPAFASTPPEVPAIVDLRAFVSDKQSPDSHLRFTTGTALGGTVELMADGFSARFTPTEHSGDIHSFQFTARDQGNDPRLIRHYRFESPDSPADGLATDASGFAAHGELSATGSGSAIYQDDAPPAFPPGESRSLRLTEPGAADHARLRTSLPPGTRDLNNQDWTASFWFKRATQNTHDFLFYVGSGNGFSGEGHELEIFAPANANTLRMQYWDGANVKQADLTSPAVAVAGQWHHAAVVWQAGGGGQGTLTLYLNGESVGSASVTAAFKQGSPLVFGGIQSSAPDPRNLNGWLDDVALYAAALDAGEIISLAQQPAANHAGLDSSGSIQVLLDPMAANLDGHWMFENDMVDVSGSAWELSPAAGASLATDRRKQGNSSLSIPLEGDFATSTLPIPLGVAFTLAAWIYLPSGENSIRTIAANSASGFNADGFRLFVNRFNAANAELVLETGNGSQATIISSPAGTVATDRWQHVAALVDRASGEATLFLNASPVATGAVRTDFNNNAPIALGAMTNGIHGLRGNIDDFRIYSHLLTTAELNSLVAAFNVPPQVTAPPSITIPAGTSSAALPITLDDEESGPGFLTLSASSSNPGILPPENITLGGSGAARTITVMPVAWNAGVVTVTLSASDGLATTQTGFQVTVTNAGYPGHWIATASGDALPWSTATHWAMNIPPYPGAACDLDFLGGIETTSGTIIASQDLASPFVSRSMRLGGTGAASLRIIGFPLSLVNNGSGTPSIALDAAGPMTHTVEMPMQFANDCAVSGDGDATFDFHAPISGAGGLIKTGASTIILSGNNEFTGAVSVLSGAVRATHDSALGATPTGTTVQGGTALAALEIADGITSAEPIQLVMHNTPGHTQLRNLSGNNTLTGQLSLNAGGARWDVHSSAGWLHLAGPVVNIANPPTPDTWRKLNLGGNAGGTLSGAIQDSAKSKLNVSVHSGTWHLTGIAKSHTGTTEVTGGTLVVDTSLQSRLLVSAGATFRGQGGSTSAALELQPDAIIEVAPASWDTPPAAFAAASLQFSRIVVRVDSSQLAGFTESARLLPLLSSASPFPQPDLSQLTIETDGFPGQGRWSVVTVPESGTISLQYQPDLYQLWTSGIDWQGRDPSDDADPDADGLGNFLEYALGGDPLYPDPSILPVVYFANNRLAVGFNRVADPALHYEVQASSDLSHTSWKMLWHSTGPANVAGFCLVEDHPPTPAPLSRFLRLRVGFSAPETKAP